MKFRFCIRRRQFDKLVVSTVVPMTLICFHSPGIAILAIANEFLEPVAVPVHTEKNQSSNTISGSIKDSIMNHNNANGDLIQTESEISEKPLASKLEKDNNTNYTSLDKAYYQKLNLEAFVKSILPKNLVQKKWLRNFHADSDTVDTVGLSATISDMFQSVMEPYNNNSDLSTESQNLRNEHGGHNSEIFNSQFQKSGESEFVGDELENNTSRTDNSIAESDNNNSNTRKLAYFWTRYSLLHFLHARNLLDFIGNSLQISSNTGMSAQSAVNTTESESESGFSNRLTNSDSGVNKIATPIPTEQFQNVNDNANFDKFTVNNILTDILPFLVFLTFYVSIIALLTCFYTKSNQILEDLDFLRRDRFSDELVDFFPGLNSNSLNSTGSNIDLQYIDGALSTGTYNNSKLHLKNTNKVLQNISISSLVCPYARWSDTASRLKIFHCNNTNGNGNNSTNDTNSFCINYMFGTNSNLSNQNENGPNTNTKCTSFSLFVILWSVLMLLDLVVLVGAGFISLVVLGMIGRGRIREVYRLPKSPISDFLAYCCCMSCAIAQEARQLERDAYIASVVVKPPVLGANLSMASRSNLKNPGSKSG